MPHRCKPQLVRQCRPSSHRFARPTRKQWLRPGKRHIGQSPLMGSRMSCKQRPCSREIASCKNRIVCRHPNCKCQNRHRAHCGRFGTESQSPPVLHGGLENQWIHRPNRTRSWSHLSSLSGRVELCFNMLPFARHFCAPDTSHDPPACGYLHKVCEGDGA